MKTHINITTEAIKVDRNLIYIKCPLCHKSKYSKKPMIHKFNSYQNTDNRLEILNSKCNDIDVIFCVHITDNTIKDQL